MHIQRTDVSPDDYQAKDHYQSTEVVEQYDQVRFNNLRGGLAQRTEENALICMVDRYFTSTGTVLDLPCGTGRLLPVLINKGFQVTGGDISTEMIEYAKNRYPQAVFEKVDAEDLPFEDNSFDYLTSYRLMCHLPQKIRRKVISEMVRVTRKVVLVNYHFESFSPLALFNRFFRKNSYANYPVSSRDLTEDLVGLNVDLLEIHKLSWYERSSALVALQIQPA
jgi:ubiquinone/menaquinone biosynthesis C-methylase UbiE